MANRYTSDRYERRFDEDRQQRDPFDDRYGDERGRHARSYSERGDRERGGRRDEEMEPGRRRGRSSIGGAERSGMEDYNRAVGGYGQGYYGGFGREGRMFGQSTGRDDIDYGGKWVDEYSRGSYEGDYEGFGSEYGNLQAVDEGRTRGTQRGRFTGRGPRGYRRSDERIREEVNDRLTDHGDIDASDIEVNVMDGDVVLEGFVDDRRTKRLAEDVAESVSGVRDVINHLRVNWR
jgi:osmotically-inducible protein OsmY